MILSQLSVKNFKQLKYVNIKFHQKGTFLIEGPNESGKSNLFESIYFGLFGQPLITEEQKGNLSDLIYYDKTHAIVELHILARNKMYKITRKINRETPNQWSLEIYQDNNLKEVIKKNRAVNERIIEELGIDGEALLNSCFVEQKKLDKLEGMRKQDKERSLMKLLNLDKLLKIEDGLKKKPEEEELLSRLKDKKELCFIKTHIIPELELKKEKCINSLSEIKYKKIYKKLKEEECIIKKLNEEIELLKKKKETSQAKLKTAEELIQKYNSLDKLISQIQILIKEEDKEKELLVLKEKLSQKKYTLTEKKKMLACIEFMLQRLTKLTKLQDYINNCQEDIQKNKELQKEEKIYLSIKKELQDVEDKLKKFSLLSNLQKLVEVLNQIKEYNKLKKEEEKLEEELDKLKQQKNKQRNKLIFFLLSYLPISLFAFLFFLFNPVLFVFCIISMFITSVLLSKNYLIYRTIMHSFITRQEEHLKITTKLEIYGAIEKKAIEKKEEKKEDEKTLMNIIPSDILKENDLLGEKENNLLGEIEKISNDLKGIDEELIKRRQQELIHQAGFYRSKLDSLMQTIHLYEVNEIERKKQKASSIHKKYYDKLREFTTNLNISCSSKEELLSEYNRLKLEIEQDKEALEHEDEYDLKIAHSSELINNMKKQVKDAEIMLDIKNSDLPLDFYMKLKEEMNEKIKEYNIQALKEEYEKLLKNIERNNGETYTRSLQIQELNSQLQQLNNNKNYSEEELSQTSYQELIKEGEGLEKKRQEIETNLCYYKQRAKELIQKLNIKEDFENITDYQKCQEEYHNYEKDLKIREKAAQIIQLSRKSITQKVLPNTIYNMRKILPYLTADRYYDASITDDYRIKVWDVQAQRFCDKNIFSGGAKDQFSLALRLSFALATLPQERGILPAFLFLDEPLGSFDKDRADALIEMLTQGELFEVFEQIFVISHIYIDRSKFNYYIRLEEGRVVESNI